MEGKFLLLLILLSCLVYSLQTEEVEEKVEVEERKGYTVVPRSDRTPYKQH